MPSKKVRSDKTVDPAQRGHAAPKPTVDELLASKSSVNKVGTDFLKLDLQTALTFAGLALQTNDGVKRERNRRAARKAYDTILHLIERVGIANDEAELFEKNLEQLKSDLVKLGEKF
jgi:hypothetical protein